MSNEAAQVNPNNGGEQHTSDLRIVLLGKSGVGKSSLCNTILGKDVFTLGHTANSETAKCQTETRCVDGRRIALIDTPGFFDTNKSEEELKSELVKCITECAPGVHAFLIVLKVERFTEQDNQVIDRIQSQFGEEAFKRAVVVFTHGDQLKKGMKIEEFVSQNEKLNDLLKKCRNQCHVIDNEYWSNNQDEFRNNEVQVKELLNTIQQLADEEGLYTNKMLQAVESKIKKEEEDIRQTSPGMSEEKIREEAKRNVSNLLKKIAGVTTGALLGAPLGAPGMVGSVVADLAGAGAGAGAVKATVAAVVGVATKRAGVLGISATVAEAAGGAVVGGYIEYQEADKADSVGEAVINTAKKIFKI